MSLSTIDTSLVLAIASFAFVTSATPGPNNLMLLASGASFGFRKTVPHMLGIVLGIALLLGLMLTGLGQLFISYPASHRLLQIAGVSYLLWLAWKIAAGPVGVTVEDNAGPEIPSGNPLRWWQAAAFQFLNPKAWMMTLAATTGFTLTGEYYLASGLLIMAIFALVGLPSIALWAGFGTSLRVLLSSPPRQRGFNLAMGALTAATAVVIVTASPGVA